MSDEVQAAVKRVKSFLRSREKHYTSRRRPPGHVHVAPERIIAEYGYLDVEDLALLCEAVEGKK